MAGTKKIHRATVLIVDHGVDVELLTGILHNLDGWQIMVKATDSSIDAKKIVEDFQPTIAFVDYVLGRDSSGNVVLGVIKVVDKSMPVVMMASQFDARVEAKVKAAGADALVAKSDLGEEKVRGLLKKLVLASDSYTGELPKLPTREEIEVGESSQPAPPPQPRHTPPPTRSEMRTLSDTVTSIDTGVRKLGEGQAVLTERMTSLTGRMAAVDTELKEQNERQHEDIRQGTATKGRVKTAEDDIVELDKKIEEGKKGRWKVALAMIGVMVAALSAGGSSIWWAAKTEGSVELNDAADDRFRKQQALTDENQNKAIKGVSESLGRVSKSLDGLKRTIIDSNGHAEEYNALCEGLSRRERESERRRLELRGKRIPTSCLR
jgi:DNA-binding NarL/FixJ family response regulator